MRAIGGAADPAIADAADRPLPPLARVQLVEEGEMIVRAIDPRRGRRGVLDGGGESKQGGQDHFFAAFFFAGALRPLPFLGGGPLAARSSINCAASSSVSWSGASDLGRVALVVPSVT